MEMLTSRPPAPLSPDNSEVGSKREAAASIARISRSAASRAAAAFPVHPNTAVVPSAGQLSGSTPSNAWDVVVVTSRPRRRAAERPRSVPERAVGPSLAVTMAPAQKMAPAQRSTSGSSPRAGTRADGTRDRAVGVERRSRTDARVASAPRLAPSGRCGPIAASRACDRETRVRRRWRTGGSDPARQRPARGWRVAGAGERRRAGHRSQAIDAGSCRFGGSCRSR